MIESIFINITITVIGSLLIVYYIFIKVNKFFNEFKDIFILEINELSNNQLKKNEQSYNSKFKIIDKNTTIIKELNDALSNVLNNLYSIDSNINILNQNLDKRKDLESEIIKLKNIIKRMEKKNGLLQ